MKIQINENAGNLVARPAPQVQAVEGAFGDGGAALSRAGELLGAVADNMYDSEASAQAAQEIIEGKKAFNDWLNDLENRPEDETTNPDGSVKRTPRYEKAVQDFDKYTESFISGASKRASNKKAQGLIRDSLLKYGQETIRNKVGEVAQKHRAAYIAATGQSTLDTAIATGDVGLVNTAIKSMVFSGALAPDKAQEEQRKAIGRIEYQGLYNAVQGASTKEQLFEVRGRLSAFNPKLSAEDNGRLLSQVNDRIDRFDKDAESALKKSQDEAFKELTNISLSGSGLNRDVLLFNSDRLSKEGLNTLAGLVRQQEREGRDDPDVARRLQIGVLTGTIGEKELTRIASGYNPSTGEQSDAPISPDTYRRLMSDIRTIRDDRFQQKERKYDTEDYKAARELLRLQVPSKTSGNGLFDSFLLSNDDSERLSMALSALHSRATEGKFDHLKWAQDYVSQINAKAPTPQKTIPKTPTSGPIRGSASRETADVMQIQPHVQKARDDQRAKILRSELASERANLTAAKTPAERQRAESNIRQIGEEMRRLGIMP